METNKPVDPGLLALWRRSLRYLYPYRFQSVLVVLTLLVDVAFILTFNYAIKILIDNAIAHRYGDQIRLILGGLALFFAIATLGNVGRDYLSAEVEAKLSNALRLRLLGHLYELSADFYSRVQMGDLLARFTTDVATIKAALTKAFPTLISRLLQVIASLVFLFLLDWPLTLLALAVLSISLLVPRLFVARSLEASYRQAQ